MHTRAATKGKAENNENNHPVQWENVLVTHNGTIRNDEVVKNQLPELLSEYGAIPEVDSSAISALLNQIGDPELEFDDILDTLGRLDGSMAIHAVWLDKPGYSLLARGYSSPLHISRNDGIFVYSSEPSGVKNMLEVMDMKSKPIRAFDPGAVLLLHDGDVVKWGKIVDSSYGKQLITRFSPLGKKWVTTTTRGYYAAENRPWCIDLDEHAIEAWDGATNTMQSKVDIDKKDLFGIGVSDTDIHPTSAVELGAVLAEADSIHKFSKPSGQTDTFSARYGNIEVLIDGNGTVVDIFDWDKKFERFKFEEFKHRAEAMTQEQWWVKLTTHTNVGWVAPLAPGRLVGTGRHQTESDRLGLKNNSSSSTSTGSTTKLRTDRTDGLPEALFLDGEWLNVNNARKITTQNKRNEACVFLHNEKCIEHGQWLYNHTKPVECRFVQLASLAAYKRAVNVTTMMIMASGKLTTKMVNTTPEVTGCNAGLHQWRNKSTLEVKVGQVATALLPMADYCGHCGFTRTITRYPDPIEAYLESGKVINATV